MSDLLVVIVVSLPLFALWGAAIVEVVRRHDLGAARTVGWVAGLLLVPLLGLLAYVVVRPPRPVESSRSHGDTSLEAAVVQLAERRQRGELDDDDYLSELTALRSAAPR